ncbi:MAG: acyl-CoA synthetase [Bacteroidota bacterium]
MRKIRTREDVLAFEQLPLPELADSVYGVVKNAADLYAERIFLRFFLDARKYSREQKWTYRELLNEVHACANMFRDLGVGEQDVVSYIMPNSPETMFTVYGAETAGIVNAINPLLEAPLLAEIMQAAETKVLVTLAPLPQTNIWEKVSSILDQVPSLETVLLVDFQQYLNPLAAFWLRLKQGKLSVPTGVKLLNFQQSKSKYSTEQLDFKREIKPHDIAAYFHTGGTTGKPKLAQHTHRNEVLNAWMMDTMFSLEGYRTFFCGLPWFHVNAVMVTGLGPMINGNGVVMGTPMGYRGKGLLANFWKIVEHYQISYFSAVPTVLQMLLSVPVEGKDLSSLKYAFCGSAPLSLKLFNDFEAKSGVEILEGYGFTEGTSTNAGNPSFGERKVGSIGLAMPHHHLEIAILDETGGLIRMAETNESGSIIARGECLFPGYKQAVYNEGIWVDDGTYRWFNTGDLGRKDEDGYLWITGREKELIIRGGHNIDPKSIEEVLARHPAVALVAAVGRPDIFAGELPIAYVQLKVEQKVSQETLLAFAAAEIPEQAAVPKAIYILDKMPLTAIGKIYKPQLVQWQIELVFEIALLPLKGLYDLQLELSVDSQKGEIVQVYYQPYPANDLEKLRQQIDEKIGGFTIPYELKASK